MAIPESNQWQLHGDCSKCRRQKFCHKACKARKNSVSGSIATYVAKSMMRGTSTKEDAKECADNLFNGPIK